MSPLRYSAAVATLLALSTDSRPAHAFFHLWRFTEFFSSANGDVQFIELVSNGASENFSKDAEIRSQSTGKVFTFPNDLAGSTSNKRLLIATPNFASLPGAVAPDFTLPSTDFFNPDGDTITLFLFSPIDTRTFSSVPKDGVASRHYPSNTTATNSPTNFAGASGSVTVAPPSIAGDFNGDSVVNALDLAEWRTDFNTSGGSDADNDLDSDGADYLIWQRQLGQPAALPSISAVPEPATAGLLSAGACAILAMAHRSQRRRNTTSR